jgi:hypothetical protein
MAARVDRLLGEHADPVGGDLGEAAAAGERLGGIALLDAQLAILNLGEERDVAGEDADLALHRGEHDGVDRVGVDAAFGGDDFEGERHGGGRQKLV